MTVTRRLIKSMITLFLCSKNPLCFSCSHDQWLQEILPSSSSSNVSSPSFFSYDDPFLDGSLEAIPPLPFSCLPLPLPLPDLPSPLLTTDIYSWSLCITEPSSIKLSLSNFNIPPLEKKYILESWELCQRLEDVISKSSTSDQKLNISRRDNEMYMGLLEKTEIGYFDCDKDETFLGLEEEKVDAYAASMKKLKEKQALSSLLPSSAEIYGEFHSIFDEKCFNSPIRSGGSSFIIPHGGTPPSRLTPRRLNNFRALWKGQGPRTVYRNLAKELAVEDEQNNHHLAQKNQDIILMMPKRLHKKHHGSLHINPNGRGLPSQKNNPSLAMQNGSGIKKPITKSSKIDRSHFSKSKNHALKIQSIRMIRKRILNYCKFHHENHEKNMGELEQDPIVFS